jgi:mannosyltransferase
MQPQSTPEISLQRSQTGSATGLRIWLWWAVVIVIAAALRLAFLGSKSFWLDESASSLLARADWHVFATALLHRQTNMALYYALLRVWVHFGVTDVWLRLLSVVFGIAAIPLLYLVAEKTCDERTARLAALLMSIHVFHIQYSQEARGYSLVMFLTLLSCCFFLQSLTAPSRTNVALYICASILMVYAHTFGGLILLAQWAYWLFVRKLGGRGQFTIAVIAICLAISPLFFCVLFLSDRSQLSWMSVRSTPTLYEFIFDLAGRGGAPLLILFAMLLFVSFHAIFLTKNEAHIKRSSYLFLWVWLLLPPIIVAVISLRAPILQSRYLIICLPAFLILVAHGLTSVRSRLIFAPVAVVIAALLLVAVYSYYRERMNLNESDNWRDATRYLLSHARPEDALVFPYSAEEIPFRDYLQRSGSDSRFTFIPQETDLQLLTLPGTWTRPEVTSGAAQHERVWVVSALRPNEHSGAVVNKLSTQLKNESRISFGFVTVLLFESSPPSSSRH